MLTYIKSDTGNFGDFGPLRSCQYTSSTTRLYMIPWSSSGPTGMLLSHKYRTQWQLFLVGDLQSANSTMYLPKYFGKCYPCTKILYPICSLGFSPVCCHYMIMGDVTKLHRCNWILASFISASPDVKKQAEEKEMMSYMNINFIYAN